MKCGLYIRVSTEMQKERGESLDIQLKRLKSYVESKENWQIIDIYKDAGLSAKDTNRPQLQRILSDIEAGKIDVILCTKLDRLFRNVRDFLKTTEFFDKKGARFVCLDGDIDTTTPMGRAFSTIRATLGQLERETTAERVRDHMLQRAKEGRWNGGVIPYGYYAKDKQLYIDEKEVDIVKKIYKLYKECQSIRGVTHRVNALGLRTRKSALWTTITIRRMLTNPFYCGYVVYNKRSWLNSDRLKKNDIKLHIKRKGIHSIIISENEFNATQEIIKQKSTKITNTQHSRYILSGITYCGICGSKMHGGEIRKGYSYYRCSNHLHLGDIECSGMTIGSNSLENRIAGELKDLSINRNRLQERLSESMNELEQDSGDLKERLRDIEKQLFKINDKKQRIFELYEDRSIEKTELLQQKNQLDEEKTILSTEADGIREKLSKSDTSLYDFEGTLDLCRNVKDVFDELDTQERRILMRNLLGEVAVQKHHIEYSIVIPPKILTLNNPSSAVVGSDACMPVRILYRPEKRM